MALIGPNIDEVTFEGLRRESDFKGVPTAGIGRPGKAKILRFDEHIVKEHIRSWIKRRPQYKFFGGDDLKSAAKDGLLRQGQLIFQEVPLAHHEERNGYLGWIYNLLSPFLTVVLTRQSRYFAYFHVAIYVGGSYVVENGGFDEKYGYGKVTLRDFETAFAEETYGKSMYFVVSPPKDKEGKSTRYLVCQKALASIGVRYKYHMNAVNCETFATAMLGNIDNVDFRPIQTEIIRFHKKDLLPEKEAERLERNLQKFRNFHRDLHDQIAKIPVGIILSLEYYLNRPNKNEIPWFMQMMDSYKHFFDAAKAGKKKKCASLLNMGLVSSSRDRNGYTALMYAVQAGELPLCIDLIKLGADVNLKNKYGNTALIHAAHVGNIPICIELIYHKADLKHKNKKGKTALMIAAGKGYTSFCCELIKRGADVNQKDKYENTALMYAAEEEQVSVCIELINKGANVNLQHEDGETALMIAAREGHTLICSELCKHGADVNLQDKYKNTALMHAAYEGHSSVCVQLIINGADLSLTDKQGSTALMHVAYDGNISVCTELINVTADVNLKNKVGRSALMYAAQEGHTLVCVELIKGGADVNQTNTYGRTILMYAAREGHCPVCIELIRNGAKVDLKDVDGCTAFMIAAQSGKSYVCTELYNSGADVNLKDNAGNTALMLAHDSTFQQIKKYVISQYANNC